MRVVRYVFNLKNAQKFISQILILVVGNLTQFEAHSEVSNLWFRDCYMTSCGAPGIGSDGSALSKMMTFLHRTSGSPDLVLASENYAPIQWSSTNYNIGLSRYPNQYQGGINALPDFHIPVGEPGTNAETLNINSTINLVKVVSPRNGSRVAVSHRQIALDYPGPDTFSIILRFISSEGEIIRTHSVTHRMIGVSSDYALLATAGMERVVLIYQDVPLLGLVSSPTVHMNLKVFDFEGNMISSLSAPSQSTFGSFRDAQMTSDGKYIFVDQQIELKVIDLNLAMSMSSLAAQGVLRSINTQGGYFQKMAISNDGSKLALCFVSGAIIFEKNIQGNYPLSKVIIPQGMTNCTGIAMMPNGTAIALAYRVNNGAGIRMVTATNSTGQITHERDFGSVMEPSSPAHDIFLSTFMFNPDGIKLLIGFKASGAIAPIPTLQIFNNRSKVIENTFTPQNGFHNIRFATWTMSRMIGYYASTPNGRQAYGVAVASLP